MTKSESEQSSSTSPWQLAGGMAAETDVLMQLARAGCEMFGAQPTSPKAEPSPLILGSIILENTLSNNFFLYVLLKAIPKVYVCIYVCVCVLCSSGACPRTSSC